MITVLSCHMQNHVFGVFFLGQVYMHSNIIREIFQMSYVILRSLVG